MDGMERKGISPYRMNQIVKTAAAVTDQIVNGRNLYSPTWDECEIVLELAAEAVRKCREGGEIPCSLTKPD
ncbi:MAG TPA: hypothetical protein H9782_11430 [Candidatus Bariatricus faecipullorum]|nr:hypothetical protein [Candidatus Bariatricus faecipullorum]